ncbi:MAG TPA: 2-phospho-L-lactate guanylyltransferase [Myxococcota bacterium]|nr:2-phospho-L-lactate guanylyltransferase [Myxococcota bacterium]
MIAAVVPVKSLDASKSRLAARDREWARDLSLAMMGDVVEALRAVPTLERVAVVTPDPQVAQAAEAAGAEALLRDAPGLNASIELAAAELAPEPGSGVLVVLGDVAALAAQEVSHLLEAGAAGGVALAPSRDGGTSALLRIPRDVIPARFGPDSAKRHREAALQAGVRYVELALPSLAIDVDVAEDAREILRCETLGRRTRAALAGFAAERP